MCGIAGVSPARPGDLTGAVRAALVALEARGPMAAGYGWVDADGAGWYDKRPGRPSAMPVDVPRNARAVIVHTRWATQGSPSVEANNHPIVRPGIMLVHNGTIANDDQVFAQLGVARTAEVDSECIAAAIADGVGTLDQRLSMPVGRNASLWLVPGERPVLHAARITGSPLLLAQYKNGAAAVASTYQALDAIGLAMRTSVTYEETVPEGQYLTLSRGRVETWRQLDLEHRTITMAEWRKLRRSADQATHAR